MTEMTRESRALIFAVLAVAFLGGCSETQFPQASGKGTINAINAMPASPVVGFLIEERALGNIGYKASLGAQPFDDLSYNFNFDYVRLGDAQPTRIATQFIDMIADTDYTLVVTGSVTAPIITQWERPEREWTGDETVFEVAFAHLSSALGDVDVYLAATGTPPVLGEERAKVSNGDRVAEIDLESEEYEVIITARDDPAMILYQSNGTFLSARLSYTIAIFNADPSITGNISVRLISSDGLSVELPDSRFLPTLRTVHAALGTENIDIYRDDDFTVPIFSNLGFGETTGDLPVPDGTVNYTYTTVGMPAAIIDEEAGIAPRGQRITTVLAGLPGEDLLRITEIDNRRSIDGQAKFRFIQAAANFDLLDVYFVDTGADITDLNPSLANVAFGFSTGIVAQPVGNFDLILTPADEKTLVAGPLQLDLVEGDVVEALIMDTVDPVIADIVITRF